MISDILSSLDSEIRLLKQARALLIGTISNGVSRGGSTYQTVNGPRKKRVLSPEARERIAAAQRKRWARLKRGAK
jgi:hypothetical protein